jgi:hypothetical protein
MAAVSIYNLERSGQISNPAKRGHHVVYRAEETNRCPGCGRSNWHVGRLTAECAFCGTAVVLAEAEMSMRAGAPVESTASRRSTRRPEAVRAGSQDPDHRRHERLPVTDRTLKLLIDGSPQSFAIHNLSAGGVMGSAPAPLEAGSSVQVRFEGGIIVPATVKWCSDGLVGLAFDSAVLLDTAPSH